MIKTTTQARRDLKITSNLSNITSQFSLHVCFVFSECFSPYGWKHGCQQLWLEVQCGKSQRETLISWAWVTFLVVASSTVAKSRTGGERAPSPDTRGWIWRRSNCPQRRGEPFPAGRSPGVSCCVGDSYGSGGWGGAQEGILELTRGCNHTSSPLSPQDWGPFDDTHSLGRPPHHSAHTFNKGAWAAIWW